MPKTLRRIIIIQKKRCRLRTRKSGENSKTYEIRFRRDGYNISAHGKTIELAKENFIKKLANAKPVEKKRKDFDVPTTFNSFALYYFDTFRKEKVTPTTLKNDTYRYNNHIRPYFGEKPLQGITPTDCKEFLDGIRATGKGRTAEELRGLLSVIFKSALAHGIIERNPLDVVLYVKHERQSGKALTREEEKTLLNAVKGTAFELAVALALFCGLRPNELETVEIYGEFIKAVNSKRKNKKTEYKRIPIINRMRPYLENGITELPNPKKLSIYVKAILPEHKLYDLRTTFYTRCDELGVAAPARDEFVGHSSGALTNAYRDLSDEYLLKEGKKLNKW